MANLTTLPCGCVVDITHLSNRPHVVKRCARCASKSSSYAESYGATPVDANDPMAPGTPIGYLAASEPADPPKSYDSGSSDGVDGGDFGGGDSGGSDGGGGGGGE